jgi:hypothetical protein
MAKMARCLAGQADNITGGVNRHPNCGIRQPGHPTDDLTLHCAHRAMVLHGNPRPVKQKGASHARTAMQKTSPPAQDLMLRTKAMR